MICLICAQEKDIKEYKKVPGFEKFAKPKKEWCKECQKEYIDLQKSKKQEKIFQLKKGMFVLEFK